MPRVYCDTCIYINIVKNEKDKFRPLADFALSFFNEVKKGKYILITSDFVFEEFKRKIGNLDFINDLLEVIQKENRIHIITSKEDEAEARKLSRQNFPDALHVVLAKKVNAIILTTRNMSDFIEFREYLDKHSIELRYPESL